MYVTYSAVICDNILYKHIHVKSLIFYFILFFVYLDNKIKSNIWVIILTFYARIISHDISDKLL